jgi:hypothetical protein
MRAGTSDAVQELEDHMLDFVRYLLIASTVTVTACGTTTVVEAHPAYPSCSLIDGEGFCMADGAELYYAGGYYWFPDGGVWYRRWGAYGPWMTVEVARVPFRVHQHARDGHLFLAGTRPHGFDHWVSARARSYRAREAPAHAERHSRR